MRNVLMMPRGGNAVTEYRYLRPAAMLQAAGGVTFHNLSKVTDKATSQKQFFDLAEEFLSKADHSWDAVWTGDYGDEAGTIVNELTARGAEVVGEVDDWFEDVPPGNMATEYWAIMEKRQRYRKLLGGAARVSCSTPTLAVKYGGVVAPNFVDPSEWDWPARSWKDESECVICCPAGTGRAGDYLELEEPLRKVMELPHVKMLFIGWMPQWAVQYPAGKVVWCRWFPLEIYRRAMRSMAPDIIISPMQHNVFNQAKSNIKWLEATMAGALFIGERWGEYERTVAEGITGLLADGPSEWTDALCEAAVNAELRKRTVKRARREVLEKWTWTAVESAWRAAILGTTEGRDSGYRDDRGADDRSQQLDAAAAG